MIYGMFWNPETSVDCEKALVVHNVEDKLTTQTDSTT